MVWAGIVKNLSRDGIQMDASLKPAHVAEIERQEIEEQGSIQKDPTLHGGVTVSWTIDPSGAVTSAAQTGSTIHNARVEGCVLRQVRTWHFPSSDGVSQATFPFSFLGVGH